MNILLGISAYFHDSAAALIIDGRIIAAAQEERFTRKKQDSGFPRHAVEYCLNQAGIKPSDLNKVAFYDKPFLKFERLLETYYGYSPAGIRSFLSAAPLWIKDKLFLNNTLKKGFCKIERDFSFKNIPLIFPEHHLSHAASAFFPSPFEDAAILTLDGVGEWATSSIGYGQGNKIKNLKSIHFPHSLGLLYSAFTYFLGFKVNSGEYKLMGLAPYGNDKSEAVEHFKTIILDKLLYLPEDGGLSLNLDYFTYPVGQTMCDVKQWGSLFGINHRHEDDEWLQVHMDLALAIQQITEECVFRLAKTAKRLTGSKNLVLAGGVALNCVSNGKLLRKGLFEQIWVQPASGDSGGALGAALAAWHIHEKQPRKSGADRMQGGYLGPAYGSEQIKILSHKYEAQSLHLKDAQLFDQVAEQLSQSKVVGWFQGRMEFGPRALGNRSILADPRSDDTQRTLNLKIKYREGFRPFAPSVLAEDADKLFSVGAPSPYMLLTGRVSESLLKPLPDNYDKMDMYEKLYVPRSELPAITHVDFSARVQSVDGIHNPRYHKLLSAFKKITGVGCLVNTSFNVRGEPIVCTPDDAYLCFMQTEMDYMVLGNYFFAKEDQPILDEKYHKKFTLD
jgi:carbamoyltransferase